MMRLGKLFAGRKTEILYLFFGACTTAVNTVVYVLCDRIGLSNVAGTVAAWIVSVLFAFVTNKLFVFESRDISFSRTIKEMGSFFGGRLLTGVLDVGIMFAAVDVPGIESAGWKTMWKIISNIIVIIANYGISKVIFAKKTIDKSDNL